MDVTCHMLYCVTQAPYSIAKTRASHPVKIDGFMRYPLHTCIHQRVPSKCPTNQKTNRHSIGSVNDI